MIAWWDEQCDAYKEVLAGHPKRQEFDQLTTLEEKLNLDADLFMGTYFLDRRTTPNVLSFSNFDFDQVEPAVDKVGTIKARVVGTGKKRTLRIGWYVTVQMPRRAPRAVH